MHLQWWCLAMAVLLPVNQFVSTAFFTNQYEPSGVYRLNRPTSSGQAPIIDQTPEGTALTQSALNRTTLDKAASDRMTLLQAAPSQAVPAQTTAAQPALTKATPGAQSIASTGPQTTKKPAPPPGEVIIVIDLDKCNLTIMSDGQPYRSYPVAIGEVDTPSPVGEWKVNHKSLNWGTGFGTRWLGLDVPWGIYGIHGTNKPWSIGHSASHGCIRMYNRHVEEIFPWIKNGTRVRIVGQARFFPGYQPRTIRQGAQGQDVVVVQMRLQELGLYWGGADGRYGMATLLAVQYLQLLSGLTADGVVDKRTYQALGLSPGPAMSKTKP